jgi:hypothetical protein
MFVRSARARASAASFRMSSASPKTDLAIAGQKHFLLTFSYWCLSCAFRNGVR